ncbi:hypothetical protein G9A89_015670 [Geosiphon pyriformis]|nr:hypothetical protein G9A89_015670 [Geosiphon pyriformis]
MTIEKANYTKLVNLAIGETSLAAEKKIVQLTKKIENYFTNQQQQQQPQRYHLLFLKIPTVEQLLLVCPTAAILTITTNPTYLPEDWFNKTNSHLKINFKITTTESTQITSKVAASRSNSFNNTILPAQIAQNANLSDLFSFEFKANKSPFLLSNAAVNEQKAITAMYTQTKVKGKPIQLILDSGLAEIGEIDNFSFTINGITIPVKVLVIDILQYQALKTQELKISYQEQYIRVPATCGIFNKKSEKVLVFEFEEEKKLPVTETFMALGLTSNWAEETEQEIFKKTRE